MTNIKKIKESSEKKHVKDIKNIKKDFEKKHVKNIKMLLKKKKKGRKRPDKDINIFLRNKSISYLSI